MHEGNQFRIRVLLERIFKLLRIDRLAPGVFDDDGFAAGTLHVFDHAAAKHAVAADDYLIAGGHHVDEAKFHADRAGPGDREGQRILRLVGVTQQAFQLFHHLDKNGVEIADRRQAHGGHHARRDF